ncbi:MAG: PEGA domain-containing protein, partial [Desulfobulbaceae bacterium]|nr:PEGA domain-containing protein [Desulfobulbaceae bacterium]
SWAWIEGDFVKVWEYYKPPPKPILSSGWLTVSPDPSDATIRIINSSENYIPGMKLKAGRYEIEISSDGYNTIEKKIKVSAGKNINIKVELEKEKKKKTRRPVITF